MTETLKQQAFDTFKAECLVIRPAFCHRLSAFVEEYSHWAEEHNLSIEQITSYKMKQYLSELPECRIVKQGRVFVVIGYDFSWNDRPSEAFNVFVNDCLMRDPDAMIPVSDIFQAYKDWCRYNLGMTKLTKAELIGFFDKDSDSILVKGYKFIE